MAEAGGSLPERKQAYKNLKNRQIIQLALKYYPAIDFVHAVLKK